MAKTSKKGMRTDVMKKITDSQQNKNSIKSNSKDHIDNATRALRNAKELEKTKTEFVWVTNGKTSKHVAPGKVEEYLNEGWKKKKVN